MDYGRYFQFDTTASDISRGIVVFRYRHDGENESPIYATVTDNGVMFDIVGQGTSGRVLHITLDETLDRSIAATLTESFNRTISIMDPGAFAESETTDADRRGYFATFFGGMKKNARVPHPWKRWTERKNDEFPLAKLILDFLFDLQQTRVFRMSPHYVTVSGKLHENFFFHALASKAKYLHQKTTFEIVCKANGKPHPGRDRKRRLDTKRFYGELYFEAEKEWTECIRDPRSEKVFHDAEGWFDDSETEMLRVYKPWMKVWLDEMHNQEKWENDKLVSRWLVARYSWLTAWGVLLAGHPSFFGIHLFLPRLAFPIGTAWLTLLYVENALPSENDVEYNLTALMALCLCMIYGASLIILRKIVPFMGKIQWLWKALRVSTLVVLISFFTGLFFLNIMDITSKGDVISHDDATFLWMGSAFIGLVVQYFAGGTNPSESV